MSVVKKVGIGVAWNTSAIVVGKVLMFANVFLILTHLSVYEYGFSELIMSIISMAGIALLPGLTNTIVADLSAEKGRDNREQMNRIFHQHFFLNAVMGGATWAILFFGSHPVASLFGNEYAAQFLKITSFIFLIAPFRIMTQTLATVMHRFFDQSFYGVFEEVFKLTLILTLIVWLHMGIHGLVYAIVLSQFAVVLMFLPRTFSAYAYFSDVPAAGRLQFWNLVRAHRKWSIGASYVGTIATNARIWIIKFFLGTEAVGLFAFAFGLFSHVISLMPLSTVLAPVIPHYIDKRDQLVRILRASIKFQVAVAVTLLIGAWIFGYEFVTLLFPKYVSAIPLLYVLMLGLISNSIVTLFTPVFAAFKEQQSLLFSNIVKLTLTLIILAPSIALFGLIGTGVEVVLTTLVNGIERYYRLKRLLPQLELSFRKFLHPDAYEREAMRTVMRTVRARLPQWVPYSER